MNFQEDEEMTEVEIRLRYGSLIQEAAAAFAVDANYAADIVKKAKFKLASRARRVS